jgi:hypothetical protein
MTERSRDRWWACAAAGVLAAAACAQPDAQEPRTYACGRAEPAIVIDGRLDDPAWAQAPWTEAFVDIEGDRKPAPRHLTRAKLAWDDDYFYFAADMVEPHLWATYTQRDSIIFHENDFEVFIDPDGDTHLYNELEINALNTVWDLLLVRPYRDGGPAVHMWDIAGLKTAVHLRGTLNDPGDEDDGWSVEIAIPFAALAETAGAPCPPRPGDRWRVNFSRVQWQLDVRDGAYTKRVDPGTGKPLREDNWVWSPQRAIAMHEPEYWGIVEFRDAGDTGRRVGMTGDDRARRAIRGVYDALRRGDAIGERPDELGQAWSWPPSVSRGPGWFRAEITGPAGRALWIDHTGDSGFRAAAAGE